MFSVVGFKIGGINFVDWYRVALVFGRSLTNKNGVGSECMLPNVVTKQVKISTRCSVHVVTVRKWALAAKIRHVRSQRAHLGAFQRICEHGEKMGVCSHTMAFLLITASTSPLSFDAQCCFLFVGGRVGWGSTHPQFLTASIV